MSAAPPGVTTPVAIAAESAPDDRTTFPTKAMGYAWYVAGAMSVCYLISILDRYILSVVLEAVKRDLMLTDTQLGILQGPSFVALFSVASIPLGRLADVADRRWLIASGLCLWSLATFACGLASSFGELMCARLVIGLGEAALMPSAMSLIVANFPREKLARGISIYSLGSSLGRATGFIGGGALFGWLVTRGGLDLPGLGHFAPWQGTFAIAGLIGIVAAVVIVATIEEPPRAQVARGTGGFAAGLAHFWRLKWAYLALFMPFSMGAALAMQLASWAVSFLARDHGMALPAASALIGTVGLCVGPWAHLISGWATDRIGRAGRVGVQPQLLALLLVTAVIGIVIFALAPGVPLAMVGFSIGYFSVCATGPIGLTGAQLPTPEQHRGIISSIFLVFYTFIGTGVGPLLVGVISDHSSAGGHLSRAMILSAVALGAIGIACAVAGRRAFKRAIEVL